MGHMIDPNTHDPLWFESRNFIIKYWSGFFSQRHFQKIAMPSALFAIPLSNPLLQNWLNKPNFQDQQKLLVHNSIDLFCLCKWQAKSPLTYIFSPFIFGIMSKFLVKNASMRQKTFDAPFCSLLQSKLLTNNSSNKS